MRSVAGRPGRTPEENARLFAAASQALDDALTAVRNGDMDGNPATERFMAP